VRGGSGRVDDGQQPVPGGGLAHDRLAEFVDRDYARLVAGLALLAGGRAAAEDAVQEALARAWERGLDSEQITSLRGFVAVAATNLLRSRFRRLLAERRARQRLGEGPHHATPTQPAASLAATDLRVDLARALRALPRRQQQAVVLHYFADLSVHDLALALGSNPGTAKGLLFRGRRSLQRALGPDYQEGADHAG
jgi:RNA polymerase sigma-70 factor, ECF subfamily